RQSETADYQQRTGRRVVAQIHLWPDSAPHSAKPLKKEPPRLQSKQARRPQLISYSSTNLSHNNYLGFVIRTKPMMAHTAPITTNKLKNAPTPKAIDRSIEF